MSSRQSYYLQVHYIHTFLCVTYFKCQHEFAVYTVLSSRQIALLARMSNQPLNATVMGKEKAPRFIFIVDRVANAMVSPVDVGLDARDQVLKFEMAKLEDLGPFFESRVSVYAETSAFVFLQLGQDDLSIDAG